MSTEADPLSTRRVKAAEDRRLTRLSSPRQGQPALHKSSRSTRWRSAVPGRAGSCAPTRKKASQCSRISDSAAAAKSLQSCPTLCDPIDSTRLLCPSESPGKNTGVGCHFLLQLLIQDPDKTTASTNSISSALSTTMRSRQGGRRLQAGLSLAERLVGGAEA